MLSEERVRWEGEAVGLEGGEMDKDWAVGLLGGLQKRLGLTRKYLEACRIEMDGEGHDLGRSLGRVWCVDHKQGNHSFIHSLIHSLTHSFIHSFIKEFWVPCGSLNLMPTLPLPLPHLSRAAQLCTSSLPCPLPPCLVLLAWSSQVALALTQNSIK